MCNRNGSKIHNQTVDVRGFLGNLRHEHEQNVRNALINYVKYSAKYSFKYSSDYNIYWVEFFLAFY